MIRPADPRPAAPLLAIDTSTPIGSVAVGTSARVMAEVSVGVRARQAESLLPAIDFALRSAGVSTSGLGGVVVSGGPGSFTGVRIAGATAKGLVRALGVPFFAYSGLLAQAASAALHDRPVCALFDARRGEVYAAAYAFPGFSAVETRLEPAARTLDAVLGWAEETRTLAAARGGPDSQRMLFAGEGAIRYRDRIEGAGGVVAPPQLSSPRAAALLWLAGVDPARGRVSDPVAWEPDYLRGSGAERSVRG